MKTAQNIALRFFYRDFHPATQFYVYSVNVKAINVLLAAAAYSMGKISEMLFEYNISLKLTFYWATIYVYMQSGYAASSSFIIVYY